jgi:hypothetical protein
MAGGLHLMNEHVSSNTTAATSTSYLVPSGNEVACLVATPFSSNTLANLGHTFTIKFAPAQPDRNILSEDKQICLINYMYMHIIRAIHP